MNTITCKVQNAKALMSLFRRETVRLPRKQKKQYKKKVRDFLLPGQNNVLHYPKSGSTFMFYWHKNKIKMRTLGKMTLAINTTHGTTSMSKNGGVL